MSVTWICKVRSLRSQNSVCFFPELSGAQGLEGFGTQMATEGLMQGSFKYME